MTPTICSPVVERYLRMVETDRPRACEEQHLLAAHVRRAFATEDIYVDEDRLGQYLGLTRYFPFAELFAWEQFLVALHLCTFWRETGEPRWPKLLLLVGRGAGKDGFIAFESFCLVSPYNPIRNYDVDICANAEEQAMRPLLDIIEIFETPKLRPKMKKFFEWTKQQVRGRKNRGVVKGRTSNPKSKDGMRSGMIVFNELHQYENYKNIKAFTTSLGKRPHPRRLMASADGDVRDGPLDDYKRDGLEILRGEKPDDGQLVYICRLNNKDQVHDPENWVMANPSLPHFPALAKEIADEYREWVDNPAANSDFMTKRMNLPQSDVETLVAAWANIIASNRPLPDLAGCTCTAGMDYASVSDLVSGNLHFKQGDMRFDINHSWLCTKSKDLHRLKIPWREWAELGLLTLVDDVQIHPDHVARWLEEHMRKYNIAGLALDHYRYALVSNSLRQIGFDAAERGNVKLVRPSDIMKAYPVIESAFLQQHFTWGDNPVLRWGTNNTKVVRASRSIGLDTGNCYYAKIEPRSRKTDPFQALVASMTIENLLDAGVSEYHDVPAIIC